MVRREMEAGSIQINVYVKIAAGIRQVTGTQYETESFK